MTHVQLGTIVFERDLDWRRNSRESTCSIRRRFASAVSVWAQGFIAFYSPGKQGVVFRQCQYVGARGHEVDDSFFREVAADLLRVGGCFGGAGFIGDSHAHLVASVAA